MNIVNTLSIGKTGDFTWTRSKLSILNLSIQEFRIVFDIEITNYYNL